MIPMGFTNVQDLNNIWILIYIDFIRFAMEFAPKIISRSNDLK